MTGVTATSGLCTRHRSPSKLRATSTIRKDAHVGKLMRNDQGQLRNGWWILVFIAVFLASQLAYRPVSKWLQHIGADHASLSPLPALFLLLVTWICLRLRRQPLAAVGLRIDAAWLRQLLGGIAFSSAQMFAVV